MAMMNDVMRSVRAAGAGWRRGAVAAAGCARAPARAASRVYMTMDATKTEIGTVKLCVGLDSGGEKVAGTQNDLIWDAARAPS